MALALRSKIAILSLAATTALCGFAAHRFNEHAVWHPIDVDRYPQDVVVSGPPDPIRFLAAAVSDSTDRNSRAPVRAAVVMDEALGAYADLYRSYGTAAAVLGSAKVLGAWDPEASELWLEGFDNLPRDADLREKLLAESGAMQAVDLLVSGTQQVISLTEKIEMRDLTSPGWDGAWRQKHGLEDYDTGMGDLPLAPGVTMPNVPPAPEPGSALDRLDRAQFSLATRMADDRHGKNAIFWQGTGTLEKNPDTGGIAPADVWQTALYVEAAPYLSEDEFVALSAGMARVQRDAVIAAWRIKYRDWVERPTDRYGKERTHKISSPPFPGYVSGHATTAAAGAAWLATFDPERAELWEKVGRDIERSRIWGGVHLLSDNAAGWALGEHIAFQHGAEPVEADWYGSSIPALDAVILDAIDHSLAWIESKRLSFKRSRLDAPQFKEVLNHGGDMPEFEGTLRPHEVGSGSLATADFDGNGYREILISGRDSAKLFEWTSRGDLREIWSIEHEAANGAFFTEDAGEIDGILVVGETAPRWYPRKGSGFSTKPGEIEVGADWNFHSRGILVEDVDGDGRDDIRMMEYSETWFGGSGPGFDTDGRANRVLIRTDSGFRLMVDPESEPAPTFTATRVDLTGDGVPEFVEVNDYDFLRVRDGKSDEILEMVGDLALKPSGMSGTPVRLGDGRMALHVTSIMVPAEDREGLAAAGGTSDASDHDLLAVWDPEIGALKDISDRRLNDGGREWSWGSAAGDINGDGLEDLVVAEGLIESLAFDCGFRIYLQRPDGSFQSASDVSGIKLKHQSPRAVILEDIDGDGDLDIISNTGLKLRIWENLSDRPGKAGSAAAGPERGFMTQVFE